MTQLPLNFEQAARDAALTRVLDNAGPNWRDAAYRVLHSLPQDELTGEDIRLACAAAGVIPHHHNAWGGFIASLVKAGYLVPVGRRVAMRAKGSHARKTDVYTKHPGSSSGQAIAR